MMKKGCGLSVFKRNSFLFSVLFTTGYVIIGSGFIIIINHFSTPAISEWVYLFLSSFIIFYMTIRLTESTKKSLAMLEDHRLKLHIYQTIFRQMDEALVITDESTNILAVNPSFERQTGYSAIEMLGKKINYLSSGFHTKQFYQNLWNSLTEQGKWEGEIINKKKDGTLLPGKLKITKITLQNANKSYVAVYTDLSEQQKSEKKIEFLTYYDEITKLPKLELFMLHLQEQMKQQPEQPLALFIIAIRNLQDLNTLHGYQVGNNILKTIATRLQQKFHYPELARIHSKDFALYIKTMTVEQDVSDIANLLMTEIERPIKINELQLKLKANVGISLYPTHGATAAKLYLHADAAKTSAKESEQSQVLFNPSLLEALSRKMTLETDLLTALNNDELSLYYQPQLDLETNKLTGFEALLRWHHPAMGFISPFEFIPIAEKTGLIIPIGQWILETVCHQLNTWHQKGYPPLRIAINLSAKQFQHPGFIAETRHTILKQNINPAWIEFEITENISVQTVNDITSQLNALKEIGCQLSIDDFGTGHSNLSYLQDLPIGKLKIDRKFICDLPENTNNLALTKAIVTMSKSLDLDVVAEGVETEEQLQLLKNLNCKYIQGFYYSKPLCMQEADRFIESQLLHSPF